MRYPASEKLEIIRLVEQSHLPVRRKIVEMALDLPDLSPRELATRFTDTQDTRKRNLTPVMIRLRLQMLAPSSMRCSWNRRTSSAVAVSGDRFSQAAKRLQLEM